MYKCLYCGKAQEIDLKTARKIQCSYCGYRILKKPRPKAVKKVMAR
jgi:DNA-directed RNA polymerase subunit RPC12/RpoP